MQTQPASPDQRFNDRYVLTERLHAGARSSVWLARDERGDTFVALKILDAAAAERASWRAAFHREWEIARALNHPHTVRVLDWQDGNPPAYAMQYIDGTDFSDLAGRPFADWAPALLVIIDTVDYWHRKGVLHGDLKPANLLLDRRGVAYLADFGAAQVIDSNESVARDAGSPAYSSPERRAGAAPVPADDVYAIAQVIAELETGDPSSEALDGLPAGIRRVVERARLPHAERATLAELREQFAGAGVRRGRLDLADLNISIRRPAASTTTAVVQTAAVPHGAFETLPPRPSDGAGDGVSLRTVFAGLALVVLLGVVLTGLLSWLGERDAAPAPVPAAVEPESAATDAASAPRRRAANIYTEDDIELEPEPPPTERLANRADAEESLGELLSIIAILEQRGVAAWGGIDYQTAMTVYAEGDRAYLAADYGLAAERYARALQLLRPITGQVNDVFGKAMRDGSAAIQAGDPDAARAAFTLALEVTPDDPAASAGLARAENLGDVLRLTALAAVDADSGELAAALAQYDAALALDPQWQPALAGRVDVLARIEDARFRNLMSTGLDALNAGRFELARKQLTAAREMRPDNAAPAEALLRLQLAERLRRIEGLNAQAAAAEAAEQWPEALDYYEQMLAIDANLDAAQTGKIRVSERIGLLRRAAGVLANPDRLSDDDALRAASALLTRLQSLQPRGPALARQIGALESLLKSAALPRTVVLRSDGLTNVALLRVERLGTFEQTEVRLRPGLYTLVGSRRGFVDTRMQFRVAASGPAPNVYIACEQPI